MAKPVARVGDSVPYVCRRGDTTFSGVGTITEGSSDTDANGKPISRDGDACDCGPCGTGYIEADAKNVVNGVPVARIGNNVRIVDGSAHISTGSPNIDSD